MVTYTLHCTHGGHEANLRLTEELVGVGWICAEGDAVWGTPAKGKSFGPLIANGDMQLSLTVTLTDCGNLSVGKKGTGERIGDNGGSFPAGTLEWEVTQKS